MTTYGTIGFPLTHSFSRQYFTEKIEREGIADAIYYSFPLAIIEEFPAFLINVYDFLYLWLMTLSEEAHIKHGQTI